AMRRSKPKPTRTGRNPRAPGRAAREAIDLMTWQGISRDAAAIAVGMKPKSLANSLRKPQTKQYYAEQLQVLRTSGRARRIHRLEALAEQDRNLAAAPNAIALLERIDQEAADRPPGTPQRPGTVIVLAGPSRELPPAAQPVIDVTPLPALDR